MADPAGKVVSRRRLAMLIGGSALTGGAWTTTLSFLARGRHPHLFVLGRDRWQVALLEHGANRVVFLLGEFEASPETEIDLLCGLLRQHIDVVVGDGQALQLLSSTFRERRAVSTLVETSASTVTAASVGYRWLADPITIRAGRFIVTIEPLPAGEWQGSGAGPRGWVAHASAGNVTIALAPSIETISAHGAADSTLAVAPGGDVARLWRFAPGMAVATNTRESFEEIDPTGSPSAGKVLVRTFQQDIAAFVIRDGRLVMPDWVEAAPSPPDS